MKKNLTREMMIYTTSIEIFNLKYIILWATQKRQKLTRFKGVLFTHLDL
jgi:hypothetical protein